MNPPRKEIDQLLVTVVDKSFLDLAMSFVSATILPQLTSDFHGLFCGCWNGPYCYALHNGVHAPAFQQKSESLISDFGGQRHFESSHRFSELFILVLYLYCTELLVRYRKLKWKLHVLGI